MEVLDPTTLKRAIEFALEHECTSIGIITDLQSTAAAMRLNILNEYGNLQRGNGWAINFPNRSYIRFHSTNSLNGARGCRYNIILVHSLADYQEARLIYGRLENPQHGHPGWFYRYDADDGEYYESPFDDDLDQPGDYGTPVRGARANIVLDRNGVDVDEIDWPYEDFDDNDESTDQLVDMFREWGINIAESNEAPDFGEISPSQELNDFVATLDQGK